MTYTLERDTFNKLFAQAAVDLYNDGNKVVSRGQETREFHPAMFQLINPRKRILTVPGRRANPFACTAEFLWIMNGRDDLAFLSYFLKNAAKFSDDGGKTWRAAYGPRLRRWKARADYSAPYHEGEVEEIDQFKKCLDCFQRDLYTRQAVMMVFDPDIDFVKSNDIPCTNWLHFMVRDDKLDLTVVMRSNDIIWGWSAVNVFNFTMMQEVMAGWLGLEVGTYSHMSDSFHMYEHLYPKTIERLNIPSLGDGLVWDLYDHIEPTAMDVGKADFQGGEDGFLRFGWDAGTALKIEGQWRDEPLEQCYEHLAEHIEKSFYTKFVGHLTAVICAHAAYQREDYVLAIGTLGLVPMKDWRVSCLNFIWRKINKSDDPQLRAKVWMAIEEDHQDLLSIEGVQEFIENG